MGTETRHASQAAAEEAARAMQAALAAHGVPETVWSQIEPVVTRGGGAYVSLGAPSAALVEQIAAALHRAAPSPADPGVREFRRPAR
ncbi:hypothetical protein [Streptomyces sp. NPDC014894]|uniref:hypothetical protein n=1 Tax=Streptomyces sp. NPDC014894 TaxID=3364931 RepID=UPI0036F4BE30